MYSPTLSLTDSPAASPIADSVAWVQGAALGTVATAVGVIAVATIGLLMLSGRLELRRGITVVVGCFILFGAAGIAGALTSLSNGDPQRRLPIASDSGRLSSQLERSVPPSVAYDPYAGASVPTNRRQ